MSDENAKQDREELAALAALGMLSPLEMAGVKRFEIRKMEAALGTLIDAVPPVAPVASMRDRLMARVAAYEELRPLADVRRNEGGWLSSGVEGVDLRPLFEDKAAGRSTYLLRMAPGATLPSHAHPEDEQCFVLEGDIRWGAIGYQAGDFVVMAKDTRHPDIYSESGNVLLLISGHTEFR